jgi:predicted metal-dependent phosphoesterase TrpH
MFCDLHMHSTASDGTDRPEALGALAKAAGLGAIALTDHDTVAGLADGAAGCEAAGVAFVAGVEISCDPGQAPGEIHLLGYFIDPVNATLAEMLNRQETARRQRVPRIVTRLGELGLDVTLEEVETLAGDAAIGRPHIARVLIDKGYVKTVQDAFVRYLGSDGPAYVPKQRVTVDEAIEAVHAAGGLASLAHAQHLGYADDAELTQAIAKLREMGLDAVEVWHGDHTPAMMEKLRELAARHDLRVTGGSDYHGHSKTVALGSQRVPYEVYEQLRAKGQGLRA